MKSLNELMDGNEHIWFDVSEKLRKQFLQFAKDNNCKWMNGDEINVKKNNVGSFMGINKDGRIGFISYMCWFASSNAPKKYIFSQILGE